MYESLTRDELIAKLRASDARDRANSAEVHERDAMWQALRANQVELEAQNEILREAHRELRLAHDALEESQRRYRDLYELAPIAYCTFSERGVVREINHTGTILMEREAERAVGVPFVVLAKIDRPADFFQHLADCLISTTPVVTELAVRTANEDRKELQLVSSAMRATDGTMTVRTAFLDLSAQRRAELNATRLASVLENVEDALALFDANQRLVLCNNSYRALVQTILPGPALGRSYAELVEASLPVLTDDEKVRAEYRAARLAPGGRSERFDMQLRDGSCFRVRNRPTLEGGMVHTVMDLTEDARREHDLSEAREVAERASAAKTEFLSSVSHELRTPLNAILGFTQLLRADRKQPLSPRHMERLQHIQHAGEHLLELIDEVLDLSRIESGNMEVLIEAVSLDELLQDVERTLAAMAAEAEIRVSILFEIQSARVFADRRRCKQVLMNFGSNAIKYGRKGGKVELCVRQVDDRVRVLVIDDGMGIPADKQATVFEPFQRAGRENGPIQGTGIGLAIARRLTELMHGTLGFESVEGSGSKFWIELPAADTDTSAKRVSGYERVIESSPLLPLVEGARVLYVEDNPQSAELMRHALEDFQGVELVIAPTAEIGLEVARELLPDVVFLDVNLPGISGLEAARCLREAPQTRHLALVALSAAAMPNDLQSIRRCGFDRHLTKPVNIGELLQVLEELLATRNAQRASA